MDLMEQYRYLILLVAGLFVIILGMSLSHKRIGHPAIGAAIAIVGVVLLIAGFYEVRNNLSEMFMSG